MNSFLDLQREAMLSFLGDSAPTAHCGNDQTPGRNGVAHAEQNGHAHVPRDNGHTARHVPAQAPATAAGLSERLLQIVRDRTGYPAEMLGLDLDLEADLGIDSIKRVEILGSLRDAAGQAGQSFDTALMDQLARERTLGGILRRVQGERGATASSNGHSEPRASTKPARGGPVRRLLLEAVEAPLPQPFRAAELLRGGLVVVTDDGRGIARAVGFDLKARGHDVVRIAHGSRPSDGDVEAVDLASPAAVAELARRLRDRGKVAGIVHALPLGSTANPELDPAGWDERIGPEVRGLFLLARELADDLEGASRQGGACLVAATGLGGSYASTGSLPAEFFAGHGGVAGLVKTLAHEWPRVRTRVVDFDRSGSIEVLGANLVHEVFADDAHAEVGYRDGRRWRLAVREAALSTGSDGGIALAPGAPVVITGGARGITAAVAADLARVWRPTLLLVGTSPAPPELEDPATAGLAGAAELKGYLLGRLSQRGRKPGPAELEQAYQALRREREVRANLRQLRALGVRVDYAAVDVRDGDALGRQLEAWRARFGPIAGFVHGAGVIQDKLLREKTPEAFDRVLGTKLQGALNLARLLDGDPLQFAAFFSSVAGRFGNQGQSDYAAANDALNKLALRLDRRWPARVVSLIWGPWSGVGMVSDLEDHLARRGLGMIAPEEGRSRLSAELRHGRKGEVEVVIAGALGALAGPPVAIGRVQELVP